MPVNSPENGLIEELFAKEGDTVQVGGDLFRITVDNNAASVEPVPNIQNIAAEAPIPTESKPEVTKVKSHSREPLIKFLGPRKNLWAETIHNVTNNSKPLGFASMEVLELIPKRFQRSAFSTAEMEAIDVTVDLIIVWILSHRLNKTLFKMSIIDLSVSNCFLKCRLVSL